MDDETRKVFQRTMLKAAGLEDDPVEQYSRAAVKKLISGLRKDARTELRDEVKRWNTEKSAMAASGKTESDPEWISAKEMHDLIRGDIEDDLKELKSK
jgi:hypothetical protein